MPFPPVVPFRAGALLAKYKKQWLVAPTCYISSPGPNIGRKSISTPNLNLRMLFRVVKYRLYSYSELCDLRGEWRDRPRGPNTRTQKEEGLYP
jgi:hypothetical protein